MQYTDDILIGFIMYKIVFDEGASNQRINHFDYSKNSDGRYYITINYAYDLEGRKHLNNLAFYVSDIDKFLIQNRTDKIKKLKECLKKVKPFIV